VTVVLALISGGGDSPERASVSGADAPPTARPSDEAAPDRPRLIAWPDRSAYTVVIYADDIGRTRARLLARRALRLGYDAGVLDSGDHPGLEPGKVVGFAGVFGSRLRAERAAARLRAEGVVVAPYVRRVSARP
jgi:hypothetical protein